MENAKEGSVSKFLSRTIVSILLILSVLVIIYIFPNWLFSIVIALFVAVGLWEFFRLVENRKIFVYKYFGTVIGSLIPIVIFIENSLPDLRDLVPLLIVVTTLLAFTLQFTRRDNARDHFLSMALTLFALFYIGWFFSFVIKLKALENGANLVAFLVLITKSTDMGAYLIGSRFGRNELIPRISPKKTKEGTLGGILISLLLAVTIGRALTGFAFLHLFVLGILLATLGQVGDLAESLIKRDCNMKDSGSYLAGIGGILDLIDSLLFTAPIFYFYVRAF